MLGTPRRSRRALTAVILAPLLGMTLALSGCGTQEAGAAAIVNGDVIGDEEVQGVAEQLAVITQGGEKLTSSNALLSLILSPYVLAEAKRTGKTISTDQAREVIPTVKDPSPATLEFVQMQLAIQALPQESKDLIIAELGKAKITINPRYGTFDVEKVAFTPITPNWIKATAAAPTP